jgi:hypothetical protein
MLSSINKNLHEDKLAKMYNVLKNMTFHISMDVSITRTYSSALQTNAPSTQSRSKGSLSDRARRGRNCPRSRVEFQVPTTKKYSSFHGLSSILLSSGGSPSERKQKTSETRPKGSFVNRKFSEDQLTMQQKKKGISKRN